MDEYREIYSQLGRLRHLPPGRHLLLPALEEGRLLLDELLPLPQTVEPGAWLWRKHPELAAHLAIYYSLLELRGWIEAVGGASWHDHVTQPAIPVVFDDGQPTSELLSCINYETLQYRDDLTMILKALRPVFGVEGDGIPSPTMALLSEALAAVHQASADPFDWVRDKQSDLAALVALRHILDECSPWLVRTPIAPTALISLPLTRLQPTPYLDLTIDEIEIARDAFVVRATTRFHIGQSPVEIRGGYNAHLSWGGFNSVVGDAGHHYRRKTAGSSSDDQLGQHVLRVTMRYEPTVSPEVRELRFTSLAGGARLSTIRSPVPDGEDPDLTVKAVPDFPEFSWTYSFPT